MVSPYLLRPLRSLQEVAEGLRSRADHRIPRPARRTLLAQGPGVEIWDSRVPTGPRLVWTNSAKAPPRQS